MKRLTIVCLVALFLVFPRNVSAQSFINLNFENANTSGYTPGSSIIPTSVAIPGWSAYFGSSTTPASGIFYDGLSLGGAVISLQDFNAVAYGYGPIQENYSVLLQGSTVSTPTTAAVGQAVTIPANTQSLSFFSSYYGTLQLTFNGQPLNFVETGSAANYNIYGADISAYAGQTGQLLFTAAVNSSVLLDNIQFSPSPVPEPSALNLCSFCALFIWWQMKRPNKLIGYIAG